MNNIQKLASLQRYQKRLISIFVDVLGLIVISILAVWLRLGEFTLQFYDFLPAMGLLIFIAIPVFIKQGLYRAVVRYIGLHFSITILYAVTLVALIWTATIYMLSLPFPRSALVISWLLILFYISSTRLLARWLFSELVSLKSSKLKKRVAIFGAGSSGQQLLSAIAKIPSIRIIAFIDDDKNLQKHDIASIRVYARNDLQHLINEYDLDEVFLALPSATSRTRKEILEWIEPFSVKVSTLPSMNEIVSGRVQFSDIRAVEIEDLLGRDPIPAKPKLLSQCIYNKVVMVTGAGGSIGSELCRQVIHQNPRVLILYDLNEYALYMIEQEILSLIKRNEQTKLITVLGSVLNEKKLKKLIKINEVDTIYHAAAYKHVPMVQHNIEEGIQNNTFGTFTIARCAAENGVKNFVLVSTDKAVRPTNIMGASKRLAEMILQSLQQKYFSTRFVMVRFGNVLDSSGSVIPLFRKQIADGGPVTVTHKEITRYFMTIPEAASLVIQAGSMGVGGDVFVLDMGEPIKIDTLAKRVIKLSGLDVKDENGNGDIEIQYTGLRPGEKLYEELLIGGDVDGTEHPRIMKAHESFLPYNSLILELEEIKKLLQLYDYRELNSLLSRLVDGFQSNNEIVDYLMTSNSVNLTVIRH